MTDPNPADGGPKARARAVARKVTEPLVGRLVGRTAEALRADLAAAHDRTSDENGTLKSTVDRLEAEVELLWAELESRSQGPPAG